MPVEMLGERVGYIPGAVNIGVVLGESGRVTMIDTGLNASNAKKALSAIEQSRKGSVSTIVTTHAHADHFGGNATVVRRTGATVLAPPIDEAILRYPVLQPSLLFAGADPPPSLRGGFLLADASPVDEVIEESSLDINGVTMEVVQLHGHSPRQIGMLLDGVFFCADVVLPESVLEKYRIPYLYSVTDHLASLALAGTIECTVVVPGHGPLSETILPAVEQNNALVERVIEVILEIAREPVTAESLFLAVLRRFEAPLQNAGSYFLLHPTIYAFLSHLETTGLISSELSGVELRWRTK